jgi:hypothetical protein
MRHEKLPYNTAGSATFCSILHSSSCDTIPPRSYPKSEMDAQRNVSKSRDQVNIIIKTAVQQHSQNNS